MGDQKRCVSQHPEDLASGRVVAPGEVFAAKALDPESPHDQRLCAEGLVIDADPEPQEPAGEELEQRARDLNIKGRTGMSAGQLREAVKKAEKEQSQ